jgi:hypothetical protein
VAPVVSGTGRRDTGGGGGRALSAACWSGAKVGREPTATAADAGADAAADEAGRWGHDGTPSDTLEGHYRTELP